MTTTGAAAEPARLARHGLARVRRDGRDVRRRGGRRRAARVAGGLGREVGVVRTSHLEGNGMEWNGMEWNMKCSRTGGKCNN